MHVECNTPLFLSAVNGQRPEVTICQGQMLLRGNAALRLLTHHQPGGWSPALAKGGYMHGLTQMLSCITEVLH